MAACFSSESWRFAAFQHADIEIQASIVHNHRLSRSSDRKAGAGTDRLTPPATQKTPTMQRRILACSAALSLLGAIVLGLWWPEAEVSLSCCWRGGAILAAAWLAYDDIQRLPNWLVLTLPLLLILLIRWPRILWMLIPALIGLAVVRRVLWPIEPGEK
ncbi:MAG: hypothetical protein LLF97_09285 [Planctomycetaceae bacterium]|nr:hypothetical protein [Planctomycetaceae bacterium]